MNELCKDLEQNQKFLELIEDIKNNTSPITISGLSDVGEAQFISAIKDETKKNICIITYNELQAKRIARDLKYFYDNVEIFPKREIATYDYLVESKDLPYERIDVLNKIITNKVNIVVTTIEAIMQKMIAKKTLYKNILKLKVGSECKLEDLKKYLVSLGYERSDMVEGRGQFAVRGGIVDISLTEKYGTRIEFWGDEVDSIRKFEILSQRSTEMSDSIDIYPCHEFILETDIDDIKHKIDSYKKCSEEDKELICSGNYLSKIDKYFDGFYKEQETLIDYMSKECLIMVDEVNKVEQREMNILQDIENLSKNLIEKEKIVPEALTSTMSVDFESLENKYHTIYLEKQDAVTKKQAQRYHFEYREINYYKSEIENLFEDLNNWNKEKKSIYVMVENKEKAKKLKELLEKEDILCKIEEKLDKTIIVKSSENIVTISVGKITEGFENFEVNQVVISADDLIDGGKKKKTFAHQAYKEGEKVVFADLKIGDYVVHKNYGIGIYIGVNTITADGTTKDYIKLKYQNDDILYVPTNQLDSIRKYNGGDAINPPINKLGSKDWRETKERVKKNLRAVARELIELYAKREKAKGYAYSKDTPWQTQFEDQFPYQETDDQLRCIEEVKKDMESQKPMDRLLCGDVGYGKTEVAIRAAFKAVMDHKQVAYLVPTTVLAGQQYEEFKERMKDFPAVSSLINEGKTPEEILKMIFDDVEITDRQDLFFTCDCSREKMINALSTIGKQELQSMIDEDHGCEITCQFCNTKYQFSEEELQNLINRL